MADQTFVVTQAVKAGLLDIQAHANVLAGNAAGGDYFYIPNDGHTVLVIDGVTGDDFTFTAVPNMYGRSETLAPTVAAGKIAILGPWMPELWNQSNGCVKMKPTAGRTSNRPNLEE